MKYFETLTREDLEQSLPNPNFKMLLASATTQMRDRVKVLRVSVDRLTLEAEFQILVLNGISGERLKKETAKTLEEALELYNLA